MTCGRDAKPYGDCFTSTTQPRLSLTIATAARNGWLFYDIRFELYLSGWLKTRPFGLYPLHEFLTLLRLQDCRELKFVTTVWDYLSRWIEIQCAGKRECIWNRRRFPHSWQSLLKRIFVVSAVKPVQTEVTSTISNVTSPAQNAVMPPLKPMGQTEQVPASTDARVESVAAAAATVTQPAADAPT